MIDIDLPATPSVEFLSLIPSQRAHINELLGNGTVLSYGLSSDRSKLWVIMTARSADHAAEVIARFPLAPFFRSMVHPLLFHNGLGLSLTKVSLN